MVFPKNFDFFFDFLEQKLSTAILLPDKVSEDAYVKVKAKIGVFRVGNHNLLDDIFKFSSEEAILEEEVLESEVPWTLNKGVEFTSHGYEVVICPVVGGYVSVVLLDYPVAFGDNADISNIGIDIGRDEEVVQSHYIFGVIFALPGPVTLFASFIQVRMPVPEDIRELELFHPGNDLGFWTPSCSFFPIAVVVVVELGEDAYLPVSDRDYVFLGVEDFVVKDYI